MLIVADLLVDDIGNLFRHDANPGRLSFNLYGHNRSFGIFIFITNFLGIQIVKERELEIKKAPSERGLAVLLPSNRSHMLSQTTLLG